MRAVALLLPLALLLGCNETAPPAAAKPTYKVADYAKDPDGACEKHAAEFYPDKVKTQAGIEEVIVMHCRSSVRGNYHGRLAAGFNGARPTVDCLPQ